jgi:hypothetical protein
MGDLVSAYQTRCIAPMAHDEESLRLRLGLPGAIHDFQDGHAFQIGNSQLSAVWRLPWGLFGAAV